MAQVSENPINLLLFFLKIDLDDPNYLGKLARQLSMPIPNAQLYLTLSNWDRNWCTTLSERLFFPKDYWYDILCEFNATTLNKEREERNNV